MLAMLWINFSEISFVLVIFPQDEAKEDMEVTADDSAAVSGGKQFSPK